MPTLPRCTAQIKGGAFCDAPAMPEMPFPICLRHAGKVYSAMGEALRTRAREDASGRTTDYRTTPSVVYYHPSG